MTPRAWFPVALLLGACTTTPPPSPSRHLSSEPFADLAAPSTAVYRDADCQSYALRSEGFRCGRFLYDFPGAEADVVRFYRETMTQIPYGWTLDGEERTGEGSTRLLFRKRADRCTVDVDRIPDRQTIVLLIRVNPRA